jgi:hypothetical protein
MRGMCTASGMPTAENRVTGRPGAGHHGGVDEGFVPGLRLAGEFYADVVRPLLG